MDAPETVTLHSPLASADDPPPSPGLGSSRTDLGLASIESCNMSMSWTEVGDEWAEKRMQSEDGSATSTSLVTAAASKIAGPGETAEMTAGAQAHQGLATMEASSRQRVGMTSEPADAQLDSEVGSYDGASPAMWSRRSSFGSSSESRSSTAEVAEGAEEGDAEDGDSIEHMRLSFPDPISSSASALVDQGAANATGDPESDLELVETATIEKDEAPPVGLGGEYSLLLDTVEPASDSTAASAASTSDTSSQASHSSSVPPSPSSNASRQLAAMQSDLESPVKLAVRAENQTKLPIDTEGSRSTSPLLSSRSLASTPSRRQAAGPGSASSHTLESGTAARVQSGRALSPRLIGAEQHDGWGNPAAYDEAQVQAWLHSAKLFGGQPDDKPSDRSNGGEGIDALARTNACEAGRAENPPFDSMTSRPDAAVADGMSASTVAAPRSMASSTATVVPTSAGRTSDRVEGSGKLPGAMPAERRQQATAALADDEDRLLDTPSVRHFARSNQVRSRRTIALLSVASAALAIALAGWARQPMPPSTAPQHEPVAKPASSAAHDAVLSRTMAFSEVLEALVAKTADPVRVEASHRSARSAEKTSTRANPDQLASPSMESNSLDDSTLGVEWLSTGVASSADRTEATEEASRPYSASEAAKASPVDSDRTPSLRGLATNDERTVPTEKTCRCREHRRQRCLAKHLSSAPSLSIPPLLPAGVDNARVKRSPSRNMQGRVDSWTAWIDDPARLRVAADAAGAKASAIVASTVERGGYLVTSAARGRRKLSERVDKEYGSAKTRWSELSRRMHKANRRYEKLCRRSPSLPECRPYRFVGTVGDRLQEVTRRARRSLPKWTREQAVGHEERRIVQRAQHALNHVVVGIRPFFARHTKRLTKQARRAQPLAFRGGQETVRYARSVAKAFRRQEKLLQKRFVRGDMRDSERQRRRDKRAVKHA